MRLRDQVALLLVALGLAFSLAACGGASPHAAATAKLPRSLTDTNFGPVLRTYYRLPLDAEERTDLRGRLAAYYDGPTEELLAAGDYEGLRERFAAIAGLHQPEDFEQGHVATELIRLAKYFVAEGSKRGDEGTVLSALWVLRATHPDDPSYGKEYDRVAHWGRSARRPFPPTSKATRG